LLQESFIPARKFLVDRYILKQVPQWKTNRGVHLSIEDNQVQFQSKFLAWLSAVVCGRFAPPYDFPFNYGIRPECKSHLKIADLLSKQNGG
jgi:hypothetical protein